MPPLSRFVRYLMLLGLLAVVAACAQPPAPAPTLPTTASSATPPAVILPTETVAAPPTALPVPTDTAASPAAGGEARSMLARNTSPAVASNDLAALTAGNRAFAFDLYRQLRGQNDNLFYSPHSISVALAMTYAGARSVTAEQFANVLHFSLPQGDLQSGLHPAFNALALELERRGQGAGEASEGQRFQLNVANSVWGQQGYPFLGEYLDLLALNYGSGLRLMNFVQAPEPARLEINDWVSEQTNQKILDLIPQGAINTDTRLVLANAIYFNASWLHPFEEKKTNDGAFTLLDNSQVAVPMMTLLLEELRYAQGEGYQVVELPYAGNQVVMDIILPDVGQFEAFEAGLDSGKFETLASALQERLVSLKLPRFKLEAEFDLTKTLMTMGMPDAFTYGLADFSGMDGSRELTIGAVIHKAVVSVDEAGTEAAAATAVIMKVESAPMDGPVEMTVDRPFVFVIRDLPTGEILFVGRVLNPAK